MEVLVAIEASPNSFKALERAVQLVKAEGGHLTVLTVAETIQDSEEIFEFEAVHQKILQKAAAIIETAKDYCSQNGLVIKQSILEGPSPAESILEYADNAIIDLIVVGSRVKKGLDKFLLGSIASKIVSHAKCSVLVVR